MSHVFTSLARVHLTQHARTLLQFRIVLPFLALLTVLVYLKPAPSPLEAHALRVQGCASAVCFLLLWVPILTMPEDFVVRAQGHLLYRLRITPLIRNLSHFISWLLVSALMVVGSFTWLLLHPGGGGFSTWGPVAVRSFLYVLPWIALMAATQSVPWDAASRIVAVLILIAATHGMLGLDPIPFDALWLHPAAGPLAEAAAWPSSHEALHSMLSTAGGLLLAAAAALIQQIFSEGHS